MRINTNITAVIAGNQLAISERGLTKSLEKLSSGFKINRARDDSAGMAIAQKMKSQIRGLDRASQNSADGISVVQTAEGALGEVHAMLQRIRELAVQGASDSCTDEDRVALENEVRALEREIDRISTDTEFNNKPLLNGNLQRRSYANVEGVELSYFTDTVWTGEYGITVLEDPQKAVATTSIDTGSAALDGDYISEEGAGTIRINGYAIDIKKGDSASDVFEKISRACGLMQIDVSHTGGPDGFSFTGGMELIFESQGYGINQSITISCSNPDLYDLIGITDELEEGVRGTDVVAEFTIDGDRVGFHDTATMTADGTRLVIRDRKGFEMVYDFSPTLVEDNMGEVEFVQRVTNIGTLTLQVGANEGQIMDINIPNVSAKSLGVDKAHMLTGYGCSKAITIVDKAIERISKTRSQLGAYQNGLEAAIGNLDATGENMTAALARLEDTDMAKEMSNFVKYNVLQQAGVSMLSQANQMPEKVLQLLQ